MNLNRSFRTYQKVKLDPCGQKGLPRTVSPRPAKAVRGMTLVETLMAVAVGSLVLGVIAVASMTASFWFASLTNYVDMDVKSRNALDQMTLKIRQAGALTEFSPTHLKFVAPDQTNEFLVYDWDAATGSLLQWKTGDTITNTLLTGCEQFAFSLYTTSFAPTTNVALGKGLSVNWNSSRTIVGRKSTEEMQQALIVMRNKS